jgi:hypothetical protein
MTKKQKFQTTDEPRKIFPVKLTDGELQIIKESAEMANISVAEYMRRRSLSKPIKVNYQVHCATALTAAAREVRALVQKHGTQLSDEDLQICRNLLRQCELEMWALASAEKGIKI